MSSQLVQSLSVEVEKAHASRPVESAMPSSVERTRMIEVMKSMYHADHQVAYLHLRAETELLLQQLQTLKQQRSAVVTSLQTTPPQSTHVS